MQRHGWTLLFHEGFIEQLRKVQAAAVPLSDSEPQQFDGDANAKLFQALSHWVMDAVPGDPSHILRIPLSFYRTDPVRGWICMIVAAVGEGTRRLCSLEPGEGSTLLAPLGHGWRTPQEGAKRALSQRARSS